MFNNSQKKSQYLQCWPRFFKTVFKRFGMLWSKDSMIFWSMDFYSSSISASSFGKLVGFFLLTRFLLIDHKFSSSQAKDPKSPLHCRQGTFFPLFQRDKAHHHVGYERSEAEPPKAHQIQFFNVSIYSNPNKKKLFQTIFSFHVNL